MKICKKLFGCFAIILVALLAQPVTASANENVMEPYEEKLNQINQELGTDLRFNAEDEVSISQMEQFYTSMSLEEFDVYIRNAIKNAQNYDKDLGTDIKNESGIEPLEETVEQRYIYDTVHYIYVKVNTNVEHGVRTYTAFHGAGDNNSQGSYPYYSLTSYVANFSENKKVLYCNFSCYRYIAPNICDTYATPILVNFKAGGGNVYPSA
ncbi:hypothetical protein IMSAGC005_03074 [Lachnospiraceae bacterium]|nr:hypothetical protein IMSAGC005_03074 [Lachnospiraceae bacterium]